MSSISAARVPFRPIRLHGGVIVAIVGLCAAAASVILRWHATLPFPQFVGACQRLRASGLAVTARDWFCQPTPLSARAADAVALLLIPVALVLPCAILAATGRRWSSLLPLGVAPLLKPPVFSTSWWGAATHPNGTVLFATNAAVLAAPVVAIWLVTRCRSSGERRPDLVAALLGGAVCSLPSVGIALWARWIVAHHWVSLGGGAEINYLIPAGISMALFAMMLGTDRRWWPWSLVPTAVLLSMGPSAALVWGPERLTDWSFFGGVAPLFVLGLVWSMWGPASLRLSSWLHRTRGVGSEATRPMGARTEMSRRRRFRRFELNAAAAALLALSMAMFRADPLPIQEGISLPTYLGERVRAQDVRTKLDLRQAMAVIDGFAATNGTYEGFDATTARMLDPSLAWSDGHLASRTSGTVPALTMSIEEATARSARIAALSDSGTVFCIERIEAGPIRYGSAAGEAVSAFQLAVAHCGSTTWSDAAVGMPDTASMCDGVDRSSGYLICRMVQALITDTMRRTKPA